MLGGGVDVQRRLDAAEVCDVHRWSKIEHLTDKQIAYRMSISVGTVYKILKGVTHKHIKWPPELSDEVDCE